MLVVPVRAEPSVAVTVWVVPDTLLVLNVIVAMPLLLVVELVPGLKVPPPELVQFTVTPDVFTGLLFRSVSCALIVTALPAMGVVLVETTTYLVAAAAVHVTCGLPVVIAAPPMVPLTVPLPAAVGAVRVAV